MCKRTGKVAQRAKVLAVKHKDQVLFLKSTRQKEKNPYAQAVH